MILKFKIILYILTFISLFSCLKQNSNTLSQHSNNNYFLAHRGKDEVGSGVLFSSTVPMITRFFKGDDSGLFEMNFKVPFNYVAGDSARVKSDIIKYSKELDENSTLVWSYHAHGSSDGTCIMGDTLKSNTIIEALKEGRKGKPAFKRFIILALSCFSDELVFNFHQAKESQDKSLFKEGIYIATSDATRQTFTGRTIEMLFPLLLILRDQQFAACEKKNTSYEESYNMIKKEFLGESFNLEGLEILLKEIKNNTNDALTTLIGSVNKTNPTFNNLVSIINRLRDFSLASKNPYFTKLPSTYSNMIISFSDENSEKTGSIRQQAIFSNAICN